MKSSSFGKEVAWGMLVLVLLLSLPLFTTSRIALDFVIRLAAFGIFATSLNILVGYGGMVSFGHAMFFGAGAYAFALTLQKTGLGIPAAMLVAIGFSALIALVVGAICVRLKEIYFSFLTLAFQMLLHSVILTWTSLTGGDQGLTGGIPRPPFLGLNISSIRSVTTNPPTTLIVERIIAATDKPSSRLVFAASATIIAPTKMTP